MRKCKRVINGEIYNLPIEVDTYIHRLEQDNADLKYRNRNLESEIKTIKPVVERKDYKPAMSSDCQECKYSVKHVQYGYVMGCRKDNVCADFMPEE